MGKRIWKKQGSKAERNALLKSARETVVDINRKPGKAETIMSRWLKNKTPRQIALLEAGIWDRALATIRSGDTIAGGRQKILDAQIKQRAKELRRNMREMRKPGEEPGALRRANDAKLSAKLYVDAVRSFIKFLKESKAHLPKEEGRAVETSIRELKQYIINGRGLIAEAEAKIEELQEWQ